MPGYLLVQSDARTIPLPDRSVHCVICSPPYFGLRDYSTGRWEGGDDPACDHAAPPRQPRSERPDSWGFGTRNVLTAQDEGATAYRSHCRRCGARRIDRQIGLEASISEYVDVMVRVFREVKRVLRDDGTLWLNMGDSMAGGKQGRSDKQDGGGLYNGEQRKSSGVKPKQNALPDGMQPKNLLGMPWRVAFALQADGWVLRSDIIWSKANPMPESVTDRPTKSHEYLFLFAKSNTTQFWVHRDRPGTRTQPPPDYRWVHDVTGEELDTEPPGWRDKGSPWDRVNLWQGRDYYYDAEAVREPQTGDLNTRRPCVARKMIGTVPGLDGSSNEQRMANHESHKDLGGRNMRSVLSLPTESWPGAHFATYPRALVSPCIKAGSSQAGCCPRCGAGWCRVVEREFQPDGNRQRPEKASGFKGLDSSNNWGEVPRGSNRTSTLGWTPSCQCPPHAPVPCIVLDPFAGSGTTLVVANALGRQGIGLDLSREYLTQQAQRRLERPHARPRRPARVEPELPLFASSHDEEED